MNVFMVASYMIDLPDPIEELLESKRGRVMLKISPVLNRCRTQLTPFRMLL